LEISAVKPIFFYFNEESYKIIIFEKKSSICWYIFQTISLKPEQTESWTWLLSARYSLYYTPSTVFENAVLNDSKQLSGREQLRPLLEQRAIAFAVTHIYLTKLMRSIFLRYFHEGNGNQLKTITCLPNLLLLTVTESYLAWPFKWCRQKGLQLKK
jgi:hypothetical protein